MFAASLFGPILVDPDKNKFYDGAPGTLEPKIDAGIAF